MFLAAENGGTTKPNVKISAKKISRFLFLVMVFFFRQDVDSKLIKEQQ
jgi:hypothetical protein